MLSRFACLAAVVLTATACRTTPPPTPTAPVEEPAVEEESSDLELGSLKVKDQSLLEATLTLQGVFAEGVRPATLHWSAVTGETPLGEGDAPLTIGDDGTFSVDLPVRFGSDLASLQPYQDKETLEVIVTATTGTGDEELEATRSVIARSPLLPVVGMTSVQASRNTPGTLSLSYYVSVRNPNPFEVRVSSLNYTATLNGKSVASGDLPLASKLPASAEASYELPAEANGGNFGKEMTALLKSTEAQWGFTGSLRASKIDLPFDLKGKLPLSKE